MMISEQDDAELLRAYADARTESAFAELVRRHVKLVYNCALRRLGGDAHLAEDVVQQVFCALARQAGGLAERPVLQGWFYTTTRNIAAQTVRTERRRHAREEQAHFMNELTRETTALPDWDRLRPVLDDAIDGLDEKDREAVILRYFDGCALADVGRKLQLTENAARMRVDRALDKLHARLARRGVTSTSAALAVALSGHVAVAVPSGLAASVTTAALATTVAAGGASLGVIGFMGFTKLQVGAAAAVMLVSAAGIWVQQSEATRLRRENAALGQTVGAIQDLHAENARLARASVEAEALRAEAEQAKALHAEAARLRQQLASAHAAAARARATKTPATLDNPIYDLEVLDQAPRPKFQRRPAYPAELRGMGIGGEAQVEFVVDAEGTVHEVRAVKSSRPEFEGPAADAVRNWRYDAGKKAGLPVNARLRLTVVFSVAEPSAMPPAPAASRPAPKPGDPFHIQATKTGPTFRF